jgi:hypothetical protein
VTSPAALPADQPVQLPTPTSTLGELEDFTAAMRAAGAVRGSVILATTERNSGFVTRLGGYPNASRGAAATPGAGNATSEPASGQDRREAAAPPTIPPAD